jgi:hypothetical protein
MSKQDRNDGLTQLGLPGVEPAPQPVAASKRPRKRPLDLGSLMADLELEPAEPQSPAFVHPSPPRPPSPCDSTFSIYGYWFAGYVEKDPKLGYWCHLYEYAHGQWVRLSKVFETTYGTAWRRGVRGARKLLVEGHRPEATAGHPELRAAVKYWQEHGEHLFRIDEHG